MQNLTLHSILSPSLITVTQDTPLTEVLTSMESLRISCVVATDDERHPLGIFAEQDVIRLMAEARPVEKLKMADVMNVQPLTATGDTDFRDAYRLVSEQDFQHLIVVDTAGRIEGVISETDFLQHLGLEYLVELKTVGAIMTRNVQTITESASLSDAANAMATHQSGCVIITRNQAPAGILNGRDLVSLAREISDPTTVNITRVMKSPVESIQANLPLKMAARKMEETGVHNLVVMDGNIIAGLVTHFDIVNVTQGRCIDFLHETLERQRRDLKHAHTMIEQSRQQETQLRLHVAALNASANAIILTDRNAVIQWSNKAFSDMTGYSLDEAIGKQPNELIKSGVQTREFYKALWQTILSGQVWRGEVVNKRKDGTLYLEEMTITPVRVENSEITHFIAIKQDITERKQAERIIQESNDKLNALIEAIPDAIFFKDGESRWLITNEPAKLLFRLHGFDWQGKTEMELAAARPEFRAAHENCLIDDEKTWQAGKLSLFEEHVVDEAGRMHEYEVRKVPVFGSNNERKGLVIIGRDISERKKAEEQLREAAAVMQSTQEGVVICDTVPRIIAVNAAYSSITGYSAEEVIGKNPGILSSGHLDKSFHETMWKELQNNGHWQGEVWNLRKNGEIYPQLLTISTVYDDQHAPLRYVGVFADISQLKENQAQLEFMALHDPLTRLPNRSLVEQKLKQEIDHGHRVAVLFIDLDRFKLVNDSFGHLVGDELLCDVTLRLGACLRKGDTLGRLGGDEFILLVSPLRDTQEAAVLARDFISVLSESFKLPNGHEVFIGGSIGISLFPQDGETVSELMKNADAAMYLAKENGRNQFSFYSKELNADARSKLAMENNLRRAVMKNELMLHYQPIVDLQSGKICGAEALARWRMSDGSWISPTKFIPLSEKSGVILTIGNWVIEQVCKQIRNWLDEGLANVRVAINISARQFRSGNLDKLVAHALKKYKIHPQHLELELTESMLMHEHDQAVATMQKLKQIGVKISLDDFGTGYSSFSYLSRFPIDTLKIDQSFVRNVVIERDSTEIASAIIGLAHRMGLRVIAEGVETEVQLAYLRENGCDEIQGYRFSTPLSPYGFADLMRSGKTLPSAEEVCPGRSLLIVCDEPDTLKEIELSLHGEEYRILTSNNTHAGLELLTLNQVQVILINQHLTGMDGPDFLRSAEEIHPLAMRILLSDSHDDLATLNQAVNTGIAYKLLTRPIAEEYLRKHILEAFVHYEAANQAQRAQ